jgi:HAD superfamily hydrolase (TIGR01450 family)
MDTLKKLFQESSTFFFDLDGCIYRGDALCRGSAELIQQLRREGKQVLFLTNNSRQTPRQIAEKLSGMGLDASPEACLPATEYVGHYVLSNWGNVTVKVVGSEALCEMMRSVGHHVIPLDAPEHADIIVLGRDTEFSYGKLQQIAIEASNGANIVAANPDLSHPGKNGELVPETGALAKAVEAVIGRKVHYSGKPFTSFFHFAAQKVGVDPAQCVMIGDNYSTDIIGGIGAGMHTVWLAYNSPDSTGSNTRIQPTVKVRDLEQVYDLLYNK